MNRQLAQQTGSALVWKAIQLVGTKAIFLARTLILARLLVPEDFGLLAISLLAVDLLSSLTELGLISALVQQQSPEEHHYDTAWTLGILRALLISLIVLIAAPWIASLFVEPRAVPFIRAAAFRPLVEAAASIKVVDITRDLRFRQLAMIRLPDALVNTIVSLLLAPFLGVGAIIVGILVGPIVSTAISYWLAPYRPKLFLSRKATATLINFGKWIFLSGLIAMTGSSLLQVIISRRLGVSELGLYYLAAKLAFIPTDITNEVIGSVAFPLFSQLQNNLQQAARVFRSLLTGMAALIFPIVALMIGLAPSLVENMLGSRWEGTVPLIQLLALISVIGLLGEAVVPLLKGTGRPDRVMVLDLIQSILLVVLVWRLSGQYGVVGAALAWLPAIAVSQILSAVFLRQILPNPFSDLAKPTALLAVAAGFGGIVAMGITFLVPGLAGLLFAALLSSLLILALYLAWERWFSLGLLSSLGQVFPKYFAWAASSAWSGRTHKI